MKAPPFGPTHLPRPHLNRPSWGGRVGHVHRGEQGPEHLVGDAVEQGQWTLSASGSRHSHTGAQQRSAIKFRPNIAGSILTSKVSREIRNPCFWVKSPNFRVSAQIPLKGKHVMQQLPPYVKPSLFTNLQPGAPGFCLPVCVPVFSFVILSTLSTWKTPSEAFSSQSCLGPSFQGTG